MEWGHLEPNGENIPRSKQTREFQDKEKELKREYKMLKEARMQSGAGWCEQSCKIQADKELWDNLIIVSVFFSFL
jgi:hypothetical protein